ncbi:MAG TPA: M50 family metallopeptidase [Patescibacteria group bacterium]|nr:M50 family metallopeptidase [Patescibacteria group bacterium]
MALVVFILLLSFLVIIHELGHFLAARHSGIRILEFGIGYPPRLLALFKKGKTLFSLNWLPFGGFVRLAGDDAETVEQQGSSVVDEHGAVVPRGELFAEQPQYKRLYVVLAGATVNILFGILMFASLYMYLGIPENLPHPVVNEIAAGSPAETAQLRKGDVLLRVEDVSIASAEEFIIQIQKHRGAVVKVEFQRNGTSMTAEPYVRTLQETPQNQGSLGVALTDTEWRRYPWWQMIPRGIWRGVQDSYFFAKQILVALGQMITTIAQKREVPKDISGPIGIVYMAEKEQILQQGPLALANFAGLLSLNLGVMNLLPIPALDGGRAVFVLLERLLGKKRRARVEQTANAIGMTLLLALILFISIKDVVVIFRR